MKKIQITSNTGSYIRGNIYDVTDRAAEIYVNNNFAVYVKEEKAAVESKEEKVVIETKEAKPKKQVKAPK